MTLAPALSLRPERAPAEAVCLHCRTPLAVGAEEGFCCHGCRNVYTLLKTSGLDRYYTLRGDRTLAPVGVQGVGAHEQPWLELMEQNLAAETGLHRFALDVQGLQCGACVWLIEALFRRQPDAYQVRVNPALGQLACVVGGAFSPRQFVSAVESFGYRLGPQTKSASRESNGLLLRTGVCLALAGNTMLLSTSTYFGLESGPLYGLVQNASFGMATLSALIGGSYFVKRAWSGLRQGVLHLDLPIALGMGLAYAGSVLSLFFGGATASYLDTVSVFIALMLVGRVLQERLVERNRQALLSTDGASGLLARRLRDGQTELVACAELSEGDGLLVCPGELVPVRAKLESDAATCTLDWINGESEPRRFERGDTLVAGAINAGQSALRLTALTGFERSDLDALLRDDESHKARLRGDFWDLLARIYVALVLLATAGGIGLWLWLDAPLTRVLEVATAVLVVTCPCAFGIATPLAYELGVSGLRRAGLFVRSATFFDRAARVRRIVFDKTGTLTTGSLQLADPGALGALDAAERAVLYDLTAQSNHPKSAAIARALRDLDPSLTLSGESANEVPGRGVEGRRAGGIYRLGEPRWALAAATDGHDGRGPVFSVEGRLRAVLECVEVTRPDAAREAAQLVREGYELWIASGDGDARAKSMARSLGVPAERALGDLTPADKRALIERIDERDTLMLGDGINDGPALSRALCSGTPAVDRPFVPGRADFYFLTAGLSPVRRALHVARGVKRRVHAALAFATAYNVLAVGLSYAGLMRPWLAAVLMPASSLLVLTYVVVSLSPRSTVWKS